MTMIKKIARIVNFGSFSDFDWGVSIPNKDVDFKDVNILYGRNYSGKTTLSRIFRALEKGKLPAHYCKGEFTLEVKGAKPITQTSLGGYSDDVRVFNTDFVKENLQFIYDEEKGIIKSFTVALGKNTTTAEKQLAELRSKLGSVADESGFLWNAEIAKDAKGKAHKNRQNAENNLTKYKRDLARDIRHSSAKYGEKEYQASPGLRDDIKAVISPSYIPLNPAKKTECEQLIEEKDNPPIELPNDIDVNFDKLAQRAKMFAEQQVLTQVSIDDLVDAPDLARWVEKGMDLNAGRSTCGFCGGPLDNKVWDGLKNHFNEESQDLKGNIASLSDDLDAEVAAVKDYMTASEFPNESYYSHLHDQLENARQNYEREVAKYLLAINKLKEQLAEKASTVSRVINFQKPNFDDSPLLKAAEQLRQIAIDSNAYTEKLTGDQKIAQKLLRCDYVAEQLKTDEYQDNVDAVEESLRAYSSAEDDYVKKQELVEDAQQTMRELKTSISNESAAAGKVNDFLLRHFAHNALLLEPDDEPQLDGENESGRQHRFAIKRGGATAHNLSEGECNIIAFCYFIARLYEGDNETAKQFPIIWIDDPVSSLDSSHIFFVYGLIRSEILDTERALQLFISTHNLNFLRYLKKIERKEKKREFFLVERPQGDSVIATMPGYLKEYATEFNYYFGQIYMYANPNETGSEFNPQLLNFANNARKFLEIFLYYRYPNVFSDYERLCRLFGTEAKIDMILTHKMINEFSHADRQVENLDGYVESSLIKDVPKVAESIISAMEKHDPHQLAALIKSIGENPNDRPSLKAALSNHGNK